MPDESIYRTCIVLNNYINDGLKGELITELDQLSKRHGDSHALMNNFGLCYHKIIFGKITYFNWLLAHDCPRKDEKVSEADIVIDDLGLVFKRNLIDCLKSELMALFKK